MARGYRKRPATDKGLYPLPGGAGYAVRWLEHGKLRGATLRGATKTEARDFRNGKIADAKAGRAPTIPGTATFDDLARGVTADAAKKQNRSSPRPSAALSAYFGTWRAAAITTAAVNAYAAVRLADGVKRDTMQADLRWLRHAFNLAIEAGVLATKPLIKTADPRNARTGFFEDRELAAVLRELPPHLRGVVTFAYLTGWRTKSEVLPLRWRQVDRRAGVVRLEPGTTKNGDGREFPFAVLPPLRALLDAQLASGAPHSSEYVFHREGRPLDYKHVRLAWRAACRRAKLAGRVLHDLRRTAVRNLVRAGVPQVVAMSLTGHKTTAVFHRYAIIDTVMQREGVAKLAAALAAALAVPDGSK
jgi:integrase